MSLPLKLPLILSLMTLLRVVFLALPFPLILYYGRTLFLRSASDREAVSTIAPAARAGLDTPSEDERSPLLSAGPDVAAVAGESEDGTAQFDVSLRARVVTRLV